MIHTTTEDLEHKVGGKYALVVLVSKRARQLREGAPKLVQTNSTNPITIALLEIQEGKIKADYSAVLALEAEAVAQAERDRLTPPIPILVDANEIEASLKEVEKEFGEEHEEEIEEEDLMVETGEEDTEEVEHPIEETESEDGYDELEADEIVEE
jgi:DNA-directed RNA polymerase subunit omega